MCTLWRLASDSPYYPRAIHLVMLRKHSENRRERDGRVRVGGGVGDGVRKYDDAALSKEKGIFEESNI